MTLHMHRLWIALGALAGLTAVGLSAWAAHGADGAQRLLLDSALPMHGWHALALLAVGLWAEHRGAERRPGLLPHLAGAAFVLGLLGFCGGLYWHVFTGVSAGRVTPIGGTTLMLGWALLFASALRR
jgi:uncharacterized membrane protein YgdD (TMEM256/DUF423 family)